MMDQGDLVEWFLFSSYSTIIDLFRKQEYYEQLKGTVAKVANCAAYTTVPLNISIDHYILEVDIFSYSLHRARKALADEVKCRRDDRYA